MTSVKCAPLSEGDDNWPEQDIDDINFCDEVESCEKECKLFGFRKIGDCSICECVTWNDDIEETEDNPELYEGDIVLTKSTKHWLQMKTEQGLAELANATIDENMALGAAGNVPLWTNRKVNGRYVVPYTVASSLSRNSYAMSAIRQAAADFKKYTCIDLVPRSGGQSPYIEYFLGGGCYSPVGQVSTRQQVSLGNGCHYKGTAIHETLHSLGFWHEQSRADRDSYVIINWGNIQRGTSYNFNKMSPSELRNLNSNYDTQSVMHYGSYAFSANGQPTITDRSRRPISTQRNGFSKVDLEEMNRLYPCDGTGTGGGCTDSNSNCANWASQGECDKNPDYMLDNCCQSCKTGTATTTTAPPTTTTPTPTGGCSDANDNCKYWAENGECKKNPGYMLTNCCKSCKGGTTANCVDKDDNCPNWKDQYCTNPTYSDWMSKNCAKSCGTCGTTAVKDPCSPNPCQNGGTCNKSGSSYTCTCAQGYTGTTCNRKVCKDSDDYCSSWARQGYCNSYSYRSWMRSNCKKSCKVC